MRRLLACLAALAACSIPTKHPSTQGDDGGGPHDAPPGSDGATADGPAADARTGPFRCLGQPFPTSAPASVMLGGTVVSESDTPIPGASITIHHAGTSNFFSTGSDGSWSIGLPTGGTATMADVVATNSAGSVGEHLYFPHPLNEDVTGLTLSIISPATYEMIPGGAAFDPATPVEMAVFVVDCDDHAVQGATVSIAPSVGTICYLDGSGGCGSATSASGEAFVYGLPPNQALQVTATNSVGPFKTYMIAPEAGEMQVVVGVQP